METTKIPDCMLSFQNNLNVISLERGDFKFSIGSLNNKFPYSSRVDKHFAIDIVFATSSFQHGGKHEVSNTKNYELKLEKKDK